MDKVTAMRGEHTTGSGPYSKHLKIKWTITQFRGLFAAEMESFRRKQQIATNKSKNMRH